jgi:hypothetical protein
MAWTKEQQKKYGREYEQNKDKIKERKREYYERNKDKKKEYEKQNKKRKKENYFLRKYNLTLEQYQQMLQDQHNKCCICGIEFDDSRMRTRPCVDHCHKTKKVRSILCSNCNSAIGLLREDTFILKRTIKYLKKHNNMLNELNE